MRPAPSRWFRADEGPDAALAERHQSIAHHGRTCTSSAHDAYKHINTYIYM
eukprot:COSAG06_NODE_679_length_13142_cov_15.143832_11_plen_51_part_00